MASKQPVEPPKVPWRVLAKMRDPFYGPEHTSGPYWFCAWPPSKHFFSLPFYDVSRDTFGWRYSAEAVYLEVVDHPDNSPEAVRLITESKSLT